MIPALVIGPAHMARSAALAYRHAFFFVGRVPVLSYSLRILIPARLTKPSR
jgi:hypothetical protein